MKRLNLTEQDILLQVTEKGRSFVSWEDYRDRFDMSGEIIKVKNKRRKDAVNSLIQRGLVRVVQSEVKHNRPEANSTYVSSSCWVLLVKA